MLRFYSSRDLSRMLRIPLNRWKRWSREFLPPDPLGGLQSGYARQFSPREAFLVYLGGFLVSGLGFSIPQARQVIEDLSGWMKGKILDGHLVRPATGNGSQRAGRRYEIHVMDRWTAPTAAGVNTRLTYHVREIEDRQKAAGGTPSRWQESYIETTIRPFPDDHESGFPPVRRLLDITDLADRFAALLKPQ